MKFLSIAFFLLLVSCAKKEESSTVDTVRAPDSVRDTVKVPDSTVIAP